jgi:hypothetical protein
VGKLESGGADIVPFEEFWNLDALCEFTWIQESMPDSCSNSGQVALLRKGASLWPPHLEYTANVFSCCNYLASPSSAFLYL